MKTRIYLPVGELEVLVDGKSVDRFTVNKNGKSKILCVDNSKLLGEGTYIENMETLKKMVGRRALSQHGLKGWRAMLYQTTKVEINYRDHT
jgi:hypothetical protein|tara:strand:- start:201 stop:473 length:273 start_codon:yes stop_codon:yes gene_type:complete